MDLLRNKVVSLAKHIASLEQQRFSIPYANDVYEAACYWRDLGNWALENNTKVNFPAIAREELVLLGKLQEVSLKMSSHEREPYVPIFEDAEAILKIVGCVPLPRDGHLGVLRIIREQFGFLQTDYAFKVEDVQPTGIRFSTDAVYVNLEYATTQNLSCSFGPQAIPTIAFWIDDLLYMAGDEKYRTVPEQLALNTERDVENWFKFVANTFKRHGHDVLSNKPGIFDRLAKAQSERDQEYVAKMNRQYGLNT